MCYKKAVFSVIVLQLSVCCSQIRDSVLWRFLWLLSTCIMSCLYTQCRMSHKINNKWHIFTIYRSELQEVLESAGFWATVCKTFRRAIGPLSCLSVLSVTLVYCGQTVGWIKMKLCMQVGLGPSHTVRLGPSSGHEKGHSSPLTFEIYSPCLLWPNGWMDQDETWYGGRPWP